MRKNAGFSLVILLAITCLANGADEQMQQAKGKEKLQLQIFLDREGFRPGKIDGIGGEFTEKAAACYRQAHGLEKDSLIQSTVENPLLREYEITENDTSLIGQIAEGPLEKSKLAALNYGDLWELVAEKFHSDIDFIKESNPSIKQLAVGMKIMVPDVQEFEVGKKAAESNKAVQKDSEFEVHIMTADRLIEVFQNGKLIASMPCTPGSETIPVPPGEYKIENKVSMPDFRWDESVLKKGEASKDFYILPPGPNNPAGVLWLGLSKPRLGIHGTDTPDLIGRNESAGCVRVANWDAQFLGSKVAEGTRVKVW